MAENPYIPPSNLPGPGQRLRSVVQEAGAPMFETGPVRTNIPHVEASAKFFEPTNEGTDTNGAFFRVFRQGGKWKLQGGQVTAGTGSKVIADIELATIGTEPADGTKVWVEANGDGVVLDGRLFQGYNLDEDATTTDSGTDLPDNTLPTVASSAGRKCHVLLGQWGGDRFAPSNRGNIQIGFCPSSYQVSRF